MSLDAIRRYLDTLLSHREFLASPGDPADDMTTKLLHFREIGLDLHASAIADIRNLPEHLRPRWERMLDQIRDEHISLIPTVGLSIADEQCKQKFGHIRLQREYGLLCSLEQAQRELDALKVEPSPKAQAATLKRFHELAYEISGLHKGMNCDHPEFDAIDKAGVEFNQLADDLGGMAMDDSMRTSIRTVGTVIRGVLGLRSGSMLPVARQYRRGSLSKADFDHMIEQAAAVPCELPREAMLMIAEAAEREHGQATKVEAESEGTSKQLITSEPTKENLSLVPGGFMLGGVIFDLSGRPMRLLEAIHGSRFRRMKIDDLIEAMDAAEDNQDEPQNIVKEAAKDLRAAFKIAGKKTGIKCDELLRSTGKGGDLTYILEIK